MLYLAIIVLCLTVNAFIFKKEIVWHFEQKNKKRLAELRREIRKSRSKDPVFLKTVELSLIEPGKKDKPIVCSVYQVGNRAFAKYTNHVQEIDLNALLKENQIVLIGKTFYENRTN